MKWTDEPGEWKDLGAYGRTWSMVGEQFGIDVRRAEVSLSRLEREKPPQLRVEVQVWAAMLTPEQARRLAQVLLDAANQLDQEERFRRGMEEALAEED